MNLYRSIFLNVKFDRSKTLKKLGIKITHVEETFSKIS